MEIHQLWRSSFYSKCLKSNVNSRNGTKNSEKVVCFLDNCYELGAANSHNSEKSTCHRISMCQQNPPISQITKRDIFPISFPQSDKKIWQKGSHEDFASVWNPLTSWLSKCVLKQRFLESDLTKSFTVCKFGNILAMTIIFF